MIKIRTRGNFNNIQRFFNRMQKKEYLNILDKYGARGVEALSRNTPVDSGDTAGQWGFEITHDAETTTLHWTNDNENQGVYIAILIQYGHGTGSGAYVQGVDYINPALKPVFDGLAEELWKEVCRK